MVVKKSKSVSLDSRDMHSVFSQMKGYGPLMALGIIAVLSVCAAFFIYRSAKGQSKRNGEDSVTEHMEEDEKKRTAENKHTESTGVMEESQAMNAGDPSEELPVGSPFDTSDLASALHDMEEEAGDAWRESAITEDDTSQDHSGAPKVDHNDPTDPSAAPGEQGDVEELQDAEVKPEYDDDDDDDLVVPQCGRDDDGDYDEDHKGLVGDVNDALQELSDYLEKDGLKMDLDLLHKEKSDEQLCSPDSAYGDDVEPELEKTTRARDLRSSSTNTVDQDFTYYQQSCADCPTEPPATQQNHHHLRDHEEKCTDALTSWPMQRIHKDSETLMRHPTQQYTPDMPFYKPDYLSFSPEGFPVMDGCMRMKPDMVSPLALDPVQSIRSNSNEQEDQASKSDKTEINIMEATMDNNEWLTGNEGQSAPGAGSNVPWHSLSDSGDAEGSSVAEESQQDADWDADKSEVSEEWSETYTSSDLDDDLAAAAAAVAAKRVAVSPVPPHQKARVTFSVHYVTERPGQQLAVTGNRQELGAWRGFVLLRRRNGGFWASTVALPVDDRVEWKFVVVEDGEICRWEECGNRQLVLTGQEDENVHVQRWWGCL
ncbi:protein starmaker [Engraulis encrasicolus]|uniref:protein starmaker n=1 Tax=Engraulis encrasicolus TaxID=184585 RepID=UPI002FCEB998